MFQFFRIAVPIVLVIASIALGAAYGVRARKNGTLKERKRIEIRNFSFEEIKLTKGMAIGLGIGVAVGLVQLAFHLYDWVFCMGLGVTFGMSVGMWLEKDDE